MRRTTIMLPDEMDARMRQEAKRRGISIADLTREALDRHLPKPRQDGRLSFFAVGDGDLTDASERVEELVSDAISRRGT